VKRQRHGALWGALQFGVWQTDGFVFRDEMRRNE